MEIPIENTHQMLEATTQFQKGIASFAGLENTISFATLKDPAVTNTSFHTKTAVSILPRTGKVAMTSDSYMKYIESFKPDIFHTLSDGDTNENCGKKRIINANNRSEIFFKECLEYYQNCSNLSESMLIGKICFSQ